VVKRLAFAVPGDLATPTGGYAYDRRIIAELKTLGWTIDVIDLGEGYPRPDAANRAAAPELLARMPQGQPIVIDGLAFGVLPAAAASLHQRNPLIALVHQPVALESGLSLADANNLRASERTALEFARRVIATSPSTGNLLTVNYGVPAEHITVARPGSDPVAPAVGSRDGVVRLLAVGSVVRGKGYDVLIAALATLADLPWQLMIAGDTGRDRATAAKIEGDVARFKLTDRIALLGAVAPARLAELYRAADLFVLASRFESYGMAYAEAVAYGLPTIGTTAGAIPDTLSGEFAILVKPDDVAALAHALRRLIADSNERQKISSAARAAAVHLPTWRDSAALFAGAIEAATK
jgi:glycosyltransferase involved in cell wall biosynthesis